MSDVRDYEVIVIGAGMAGLAMLHRLKDEGYRACILERGDGVGGTWYWNRYPGARCDLQSVEYSYSYPEIQDNWDWTELFSPQAEIEAYLNFACDTWGLRGDIFLESPVAKAAFSEEESSWTLVTEGGVTYRTRYLIAATGSLSEPVLPDIDGIESFSGDILHSARFPKGGYDFTGKRVAVVGTGSSGVQIIPEVAECASHLYVLQRSAAYPRPAYNRPLEEGEMAELHRQYPELRKAQRESPVGAVRLGALTAAPAGHAVGALPDRNLVGSTPEERAALLEELGWAAPWAWADVMTSKEANALANEMFAQMIKTVVHDQELAEELRPHYPVGCKRQVLDNGYYECFNLPSVELVNLRKTAITKIAQQSIVTDTADLEVDVIVFATGFNAMTGALSKIEVRGRDGRLLRDVWEDSGPVNYLGVQVNGFPNLFLMTGPGSPSTNVNFAPAIEQHVDLISGFLGHLRDNGHVSMEPDAQAQRDWIATVASAAEGSVRTWSSCNSWYLGSNVPGKPRVYLPYMAGMLKYRARCAEEIDSGYEHFVFTGGRGETVA